MDRARWIWAALATYRGYVAPPANRLIISQCRSTLTNGRRQCREHNLFREIVEFVVARAVAERAAKLLQVFRGIQSGDGSCSRSAQSGAT
ncbi:MAG: hypothetical protein JWM91_382 [Rhodospirillales bacterium]|nr:hypothetical protein [Rhodospirillales bacterium]